MVSAKAWIGPIIPDCLDVSCANQERERGKEKDREKQKEKERKKGEEERERRASPSTTGSLRTSRMKTSRAGGCYVPRDS